MLSSRELQRHLGVSRNTVTEALNELDAEGYIITRRGIGTFVATDVTVKRRKNAERMPSVVPSEQAMQFIAAQAAATDTDGGLAFRPGIPALDSFPLVQFRGCLKATDWTGVLLDYPERAGLPALRNAIATRLRQTRGVACSPEQIFITTGAQAAFSLVFRVILHDGDSAIVEDPCYPNVLALLRSCRANIVPISVDDDGIRAGDLQNVQAKLAYVTPSHQYPTGALLTLARRVELLEWARRRSAWIVEDDYDSEFNYSGRAHPTLQGLDDHQRVIYVGSFSKVLSPALRVGYIVAPETLCDAFEAAHEITGAAPSVPLQAALARFIERGHLGRHISKMRKIYDARRRFISSYISVAKDLPFKVRDSASGLHFIAELPESMPDRVIADEALKVGVVMRALSSYYVGEPLLNGVVIGYAATPVHVAQAAIDALLQQIAAK